MSMEHLHALLAKIEGQRDAALARATAAETELAKLRGTAASSLPMPRGVERDIEIPTDDEMIGEGARLRISASDDWYVSVIAPGERAAEHAVRFCTSGARSYARTMAVALLHAVADGDRGRVQARAEALLGHFGLRTIPDHTELITQSVIVAREHERKRCLAIIEGVTVGYEVRPVLSSIAALIREGT